MVIFPIFSCVLLKQTKLQRNHWLPNHILLLVKKLNDSILWVSFLCHVTLIYLDLKKNQSSCYISHCPHSHTPLETGYGCLSFHTKSLSARCERFVFLRSCFDSSTCSKPLHPETFHCSQFLLTNYFAPDLLFAESEISSVWCNLVLFILNGLYIKNLFQGKKNPTVIDLFQMEIYSKSVLLPTMPDMPCLKQSLNNVF